MTVRMIDADSLKEYILRSVPNWSEDREIGLDCIANSPTIEERKTGKWEEREVSSEKVIDEWQSARCSVCGKYHTTPYMYFFHDYNYCPNCGADMRGETDE